MSENETTERTRSSGGNTGSGRRKTKAQLAAQAAAAQQETKSPAAAPEARPGGGSNRQSAAFFKYQTGPSAVRPLTEVLNPPPLVVQGGPPPKPGSTPPPEQKTPEKGKIKKIIAFRSLFKFLSPFLIVEFISAIYALYASGLKVPFIGSLVAILPTSPFLAAGLMFFVALWPIAYVLYSRYQKQLSVISRGVLTGNTLLLSVAPALLLLGIPSTIIATIFTATCFIAAFSFFVAYKMQNKKWQIKLWPDGVLLGLMGVGALAFLLSPILFVSLSIQVSPFVVGGIFITGISLSIFSIRIVSDLMDGKEISPSVRAAILSCLVSPIAFITAPTGAGAIVVFVGVCVLPLFTITALYFRPSQVPSKALQNVTPSHVGESVRDFRPPERVNTPPSLPWWYKPTQRQDILENLAEALKIQGKEGQKDHLALVFDELIQTTQRRQKTKLENFVKALRQELVWEKQRDIKYLILAVLADPLVKKLIEQFNLPNHLAPVLKNCIRELLSQSTTLMTVISQQVAAEEKVAAPTKDEVKNTIVKITTQLLANNNFFQEAEEFLSLNSIQAKFIEKTLPMPEKERPACPTFDTLELGQQGFDRTGILRRFFSNATSVSQATDHVLEDTLTYKLKLQLLRGIDSLEEDETGKALLTKFQEMEGVSPDNVPGTSPS